MELQVIDEPAAASLTLDPVKGRILAALAEPGSATTIADDVGLTRQKVNYHLKALEEHGLVELVEERPRRGLVERVVVATAQSYVISPDALGDNAPDPTRTDRLSARYLIAVAARLIAETAKLVRRADAADKRLATLTLDSEIRFASADARAAFTSELTSGINGLVAKYHDETSDGGRWHRLVVAAHPHPTPPGMTGTTEEQSP